MKKTIILASILLLLGGCRSEEEKEKLRTNPEVTEVVVVDGCVVKFADRGDDMNSFFIARCGDTTTLTSNYMVQSGKTRVPKRKALIAQEIQKLQQEQEQLDAEEVEQAKKYLDSLTPEQRKKLLEGK